MHEISLHILDLVENSTGAGANKVTVTLEEDSHHDELRLCITDNGRGMDAGLVAKVTDPFVTSRTTRKVGLGLPLMDMTTQLCGGYLRIDSVVGQGTKVEASWKMSHLDRPPLGNLVATVKAILVTNPELHFQYDHRVDDRSFTLDSGEIRAALGDLPLTQPDVLDWLDQYLKENLSILYGGKAK